MDELLNHLKPLPDSLETHTGWLMSLALKIWKECEGIDITKFHYMFDGCRAIVHLPADKKTYQIDIKEVSHDQS